MVNLLFDPQQTPHVQAADVAAAFGVSQSNMATKSKQVRTALGMSQMDPDWTVPSMVAANPMAWMLMIDGFAVDARQLPREQQVELHERGYIPFVHADRSAGQPTG